MGKKLTKSPELPESQAVPQTTAAPLPKPLVFVSHDSRDADLAEAFSNLLTDASGGTLRSFRSSDKKGTAGIEFGQEWYRAIMEKLGTATDVVALLTHHSINRPWILYEAGVAKGKLDTIVFGVAMGIPLDKVSIGPFAQFQNCGDDEDSLTKLVLQLIRRNPDAEPREEAVQLQVKAFIAKLGSLVKDRKPSEPPQKMDDAGVAKLFEEVKVMFQELPTQFERRTRDLDPSRRRRFRSFPPGFVFDMAMMVGQEDNLEGLLVLSSILRDDVPWIASIVTQIYESSKRGDRQDLEPLMHTLVRLCEITAHGPFGREIFGEVREYREFVSELPKFVDHYLHRTMRTSRKRPSTR